VIITQAVPEEFQTKKENGTMNGNEREQTKA
jgi:hypothetical protein